MSEVKNKKKKSSIIQVSIGVLAVILAILIIIMMGIVSDIQGTARIVNYTGLVRATGLPSKSLPSNLGKAVPCAAEH